MLIAVLLSAISGSFLHSLTPVVLLGGPHCVGKTTTCRLLSGNPGVLTIKQRHLAEAVAKRHELDWQVIMREWPTRRAEVFRLLKHEITRAEYALCFVDCHYAISTNHAIRPSPENQRCSSFIPDLEPQFVDWLRNDGHKILAILLVASEETLEHRSRHRGDRLPVPVSDSLHAERWFFQQLVSANTLAHAELLVAPSDRPLDTLANISEVVRSTFAIDLTPYAIS